MTGDHTTKGRATDAFAADPSMSGALHTMAEEDELAETAGRMRGDHGKGDARTDRRRRRQRGELDVKTADEGRMAGAIAVGAEAPDGAAADAAGGKGKGDFKLQQLRGIFAAFDENRDGVLTKEELGNALLALGINPTQKAIQKYQMAAHSSTIDLPSFIRVSLHKLDGLETTEADIATVFEEFDKDRTGMVPASVLRHLLCQVQTKSQLTEAELSDLLRFTGIPEPDEYGARPETMVDYRHVIRSMMF